MASTLALALTANDTLADGVVDTERDPGDAVIAEQSGASTNTGSGNRLSFYASGLHGVVDTILGRVLGWRG